MGKTFRETLNKQLKENSEFRHEYEALNTKYEIIKTIVKSRKDNQLTQKELAERTGINQADISKLERGNANPSIRTLRRIASAMNMDLKVEFIPRD